MFFLRIIENILILYYIFYFLIDWTFFLIFFISIRKEKLSTSENDVFRKYPVSVIVPAYNEEITIVHSIKMLLALDYPKFEIIVVNDGSTDNTLDKIIENFSLKENKIEIPEKIKTKEINKILVGENGKLVVIDKKNGGKADSINVGINYSEKKLVCTIDADSILDKSALKQTVQPMIDDKKVFVSGGQLAVANGVTIVDNRVVNSHLPKNKWIQWQIVEYLKSFMIARYSLSKLNSILIMSGAFSVYKREDLLYVGGFLTERNDSEFIRQLGSYGKQTVCEDMEIIVRLWRYFYDKKIEARAVFLPHPVCWTEVPDNPSFLKKQRNRWHRGLAETLQIHKAMMFEPKYKAIGLFSFPYYYFFELYAPLIKIFTFFFIVLEIALGNINSAWMLLTIIFATTVSALITSVSTVYIEQWTRKKKLVSFDALRYKTGKDWLTLIFMNVLGDFVYSPFRVYAQLCGLKDFLMKKKEWYKFNRKGFKEK